MIPGISESIDYPVFYNLNDPKIAYLVLRQPLSVNR